MAQEETIKGLHVVEFIKDYAHYEKTKHKRNIYRLNEYELKKILLSEEIKNLPVAVISVAGVLRSGKSFLLNYFLRYLSATPSDRANGSWLGKPGQQLTGFGWEPGTDRNTTGILIWPKPFIIQIPSGERVAVLLMDTQGTFDKNSSTRDNSTIFALSTLLSSTQIYNIKDKINESDLMNLELFTQYGTLVKEKTGKSFQELKFLIRDWVYDWQHQYGEIGGESYKESEFNITEPEQLVKIRKHITDSFESVTCFLMPHPGKLVPKPAFKANPGELEPEFTAALIELVHTIFDSKRLCMKRLGGQPVRSRELFEHFRTHVAIFNSDDLPEPKTVLQALSEAGLLMAANATIELFEKNVARECELSMPAAELIELHNQQVELALASFEGKRLFGDSQDVAKKREEIRKELTECLGEMLSTNNAKTQKAVTNSIAAYDAVIQTSALDKQSCEYAFNMKQAHEEAFNAAMRVFDENRKTLSPGKTDLDRQSLHKSRCEAGLFIVAKAARKQFKNNMTHECTMSMPEEELKELYNQQLELALAAIEGEHLFGDVTNTHDEIKKELTNRLEAMLGSNNEKMMTSVTNGVAAYNATLQTLAPDKQSSEYALKMKQAHETAIEAAMRAFDKNRKTLSSGQTDPDRQTFLKARRKAGLLMVATAAREQFENTMSRECALSMPAQELEELHNRQVELALAPFEDFCSFGDQQEVTSKQEEIRMKLTDQLGEMLRINNAKTNTAMKNGIAAYDAVIQRSALDKQSCKYALNVKQAHEEAFIAAITVFDENRKTLSSGKTDPDRQSLLKSRCEAGLLMVANAAREQFKNNMSRECKLSMPEVELKELHNQQLQLVLTLFEGEHLFGDVTNTHKEIKTELTNRLDEMLGSNNAKLMTAVTNSIAAYDDILQTSAPNKQSSEYALKMKQAHEAALEGAMRVFDENRKTLTLSKTDTDRQSFLQARCKNGLLMVATAASEQFENNMSRECALSMPAQEFEELHSRQLELALAPFEDNCSFGGQQEVTSKQEEIRMELTNRLNEMLRSNSDKTVTAVTKAVAAYNTVLETLAPDQQSYELALNLKNAHEAALVAATCVFDENRKTLIAGNPDPDRQEFIDVQCRAGLLKVVNAARDQFEMNMIRECALSMPEEELLALHNQQLELALAPFEGNHSFGNQQEVERKREEIRVELISHLEEMYRLNNANSMAAMARGVAAYESVIETLSGDQLLCVHTLDLLQAHREAILASTSAFDENRKTLVACQTDPDRQRLLEQCDAAYENYKQLNAANNRAVLSEVLGDYHQRMTSLCGQNLSEAEFLSHHEGALARALEEFELRRNCPNQYPEDTFKNSLLEDINVNYLQYQQINASNNADLIQQATMTYNQECMTEADLENGCLHPDDLQLVHNNAVAKALEVFRPGRPAREGFSEDNPDEQIIKNLIDSHLATMVGINHRRNESAKEIAFDAYKRKFSELIPSGGLLIYRLYLLQPNIATETHREAFSEARSAFYEKRQCPRDVTTLNTSPDRYFEALEERCIGFSSNMDSQLQTPPPPPCIVM